MDFINQCAYLIWENQPILALIIDIVLCLAPIVINKILNEDDPPLWGFCFFAFFLILSICSYIQFTQLVRVPKVTGESYDNAVQTLNANELEFEIVGDLVNDYVDDQEPEQGTIVKKGEVIKLSFDGAINKDNSNETGETPSTGTNGDEIPGNNPLEPATPSDNEYDSSTTIDPETQEDIAFQQDETIDIPPIEKHTQNIDNIPQNTISIDSAEIVSYNDNLYDNQQVTYSFAAKYNGRYRADISGLQNGTIVELYLCDNAGNTIASDTYCKNNEGITAGLTAENEYVVKVVQHSGNSAFTLKIGMQKERTDISSLTELSDSIDFIDQRNVYTFTVPRDGRYRFELSGMMNGTIVEMYMFNDLMETVESDTYCKNGEGITAMGLKAGETYQIQIRQLLGLGSYTLSIGRQKEYMDISEFTEVTDSIEFTDQRNVYIFKVPIDGRYRFEISGMMNGTSVELHMFDELDNDIASDTYCKNGEGITVKNLKAGDIYKVQVRQSIGFSGYVLSIGQQKKTVEIRNKCTIIDSIEYTDQRNVYSFGPDMSGNTTFTISGMKSGTGVEFYIYNELGETIASDSYFINGESISIENVPVNSNYTAQVRQLQGMSNYTLKVE